MNSIRFCYRRSEIEADKARRMRPQKFDSQIASPFVCSEIKSVDTKVSQKRKIGNSNDKLNFHTRLVAESAAVGDAFHLNSIFVNLPMLSL